MVVYAFHFHLIPYIGLLFECVCVCTHVCEKTEGENKRKKKETKDERKKGQETRENPSKACITLLFPIITMK